MSDVVCCSWRLVIVAVACSRSLGSFHLSLLGSFHLSLRCSLASSFVAYLVSGIALGGASGFSEDAPIQYGRTVCRRE